NRTIIVNSDDKESKKFANYPVENKISFNICDIEPYIIKDVGLEFTLNGKTIQSKLSGLFNLYNILASITVAQNEGISLEKISSAIEKLETIPGRVEKIKLDKQDFGVIVDYAHTPDSLEKLYQVFRSSKNICVLGGTGGGRDTWKRGEMGRIA
ncbi:MAG: cyanophycin synthetase, partial [Candidatus Taylorbacteria bacterium]